jgi:maltooligosyltrehalose trehalohydrolase
MGQEWGTETPFLFFTDHHGELAEAVRQGRQREFAKFAAFADPERRKHIPDPNTIETYEKCRIDPAEALVPKHAAWLELHRALLTTRAHHIVPYMPGTRAISATALGQTGVRASWRLGNGAILTIAANFGTAALECPIDGKVLFATPGATTEHLPPLSCIVTLDPR